MTIRPNVDLGASFDRLKDAFKKSEKLYDALPGIEGLTQSYAHLFANVEHFVKEFDDVQSVDDIPNDIFVSPKAN